MTTERSITEWIARLKAGDAEAVRALWDAYFARLVDLARHRLVNAPRRAADEEDVALSAFHSFCARATAGQFPRLNDRENLWPLLVVITARKCAALVRHETRQKRHRAERLILDLETIVGREPTAEFVALVADELEHLLGQLDQIGDPELRQIALWKLDGTPVAEIAARLGCVRRTVERKTQVMVAIWEREG